MSASFSLPSQFWLVSCHQHNFFKTEYSLNLQLTEALLFWRHILVHTTTHHYLQRFLFKKRHYQQIKFYIVPAIIIESNSSTLVLCSQTQNISLITVLIEQTNLSAERASPASAILTEQTCLLQI